MALRNIVLDGDEGLRKKSRPVTEITDKIRTLLDDMADTMYDACGAGLAAPQVGVLRRIFIVDAGEGLMELINPEIIETKGSAVEDEACLSVPGRCGEVERPEYVKIKALDRYGNEVVYEGTELLARAFCHENDHLDGILYTDITSELWDIE